MLFLIKSLLYFSYFLVLYLLIRIIFLIFTIRSSEKLIGIRIFFRIKILFSIILILGLTIFFYIKDYKNLRMINKYIINNTSYSNLIEDDLKLNKEEYTKLIKFSYIFDDKKRILKIYRDKMNEYPEKTEIHTQFRDQIYLIVILLGD